MQLAQRQVVTTVVPSANSSPFRLSIITVFDVAETLASPKVDVSFFFSRSIVVISE
jgi:hypothetical protein